MTESQIVSEILLRVGSRPDCRIWRSQPLVARASSGRVIRALPQGHPDLCGVLRGGRMLMIEVKSASGYLRKEQAAWQKMLEGFGALYVLAHSVEEVEEAINCALATPVVSHVG